MKTNNLTIILLLLTTFKSMSIHAHELNIPIPKVSLNSSSVALDKIQDLQTKYFEKKLAHNPDYIVNTYLGNFQTSFKIDLPQNDLIKDLWFDYNSSYPLNNGLGVGFTIRLPKISKRDNKFFFTLNSSNELVETIEKVNVDSRLNLISQALNRKITILKSFRLKDEEDFSLFFKTNDGFLQISPNGESNVFNENGSLIAKVALNKKILNLIYKDNRLAGINSPQENWSAELNYKENEAQFKYIDGQFVQVPRGLNWISVQQNNSKRLYKFSYQDDLLVSVKKDGALHTLFSAEYKTQKGSIVQNSFNGSNITEKNIVFKDYDKNPSFIDLPKNDEKQVIAVDINGDFITDELVFEQAESKENNERKFKALFADVVVNITDERSRSYIDEDKFQAAKNAYENYLNSSKFNVSVRFGKFDGKNYQLESDNSLNLSIDAHDIGSYKVIEGANHSTSVQFEQIRIPRLIDLNNDGKKDLALISYKAEKNFVESNKKQDILVLSAFNLANRPLHDNIFKYEGETLIIYLLKTNESKLSSLPVNNGSDIYQVLNVSYWEKINSNIKLHSHSMMIDYNRDGINDILTGKTVYLLGGNGESQEVKLTDAELKSLFDVSELSANMISTNRYGLIDTDGKGVWKTYQTSNSYVQPTDRKLHVLSEDKEIIFERPSDSPLLVSLKSTFGGNVNVSYSYVDGAYVVKQVKHNLSDLDQNSWEENFSYSGTRWHIQKNIFLGFKKGIVEKKLTSNRTHQLLNNLDQNILEYDLDDQNGPLFYLSRARKAGRVVNAKLVDKDGVAKEVINTYIDQAFSGRRSFSYLASQTIQERGKTDLKIANNFSGFINDIPMLQKEVKTTNLGKETLLSEKVLINGIYLLRTNSASSTNHLGEERSLEKNTWSTNGLLLRRVTPSNLENFSYDNLNRVSKYETSNGKIQNYSYAGELPLVKNVSINDLNTVYSYNDVENEVSSMKIEGSSDTFYFSYTTDGILLSIKRNEQSIFEQSRISEKAFESITLDEKIRVQLDGYGRVISRTQIGEGDNLILSQKSLDDQGRSLIETSPYFENIALPWVSVKRKYDVLGSIVNEIQIDDLGEKLTEFSLTKGLCSEKITEIGFRETLCKNGNDDATSTAIPNESSFFEYGFSGEVSSIKPFGHSYKRNENGDIVESSSSSWGKTTRSFNYKDNSVSYDDGVLEFTTPFGEFKSYTNGLEGTAQASIVANYDKHLLQSLEVNLGKKHFVQTYSYNSSRALIGKKEFNTSWNYQLDQFDRVKSETIKDSKNEYTLNYNRKHSVLTSITPYITNIEYSPRMKPTLIDFSNGSSIEYEYGPRGELLSYSLTKGMVVFYGVRYEYRSDLKLISQSVITNTALGEQVQNFSYTNAFEISKSPLIASIARDGKGQVGSLNDLKFNYHHLNLVEIAQGNNVLTNFYAENNHYIGSCDQSGGCFYKISPNEVEHNGEVQKLIEVGGVPVGLLYKGNFYPVIIDHKLAVIGLLNEEGSKLQFLRSFDEWGNVKQITGDREFEKSIAFSYSRLVKNPLMEKISKEILYFSETRVYSSKIGEWMSPDSAVVWSPEKLLGIPGNWNPVKYANNDPVNYTDENGTWIQYAGGALFGGAAGGISAAAQGKNVKQGAIVGALTGLSFASGVGLVQTVASFAAQGSFVSIMTFTGNLVSQVVVTKKIDMAEAIISGALAPFALSYSNLFKDVSSKIIREFASGTSFLSVDLSSSILSNSLQKKSSSSDGKESYNMGTYKLQSGFKD